MVHVPLVVNSVLCQVGAAPAALTAASTYALFAASVDAIGVFGRVSEPEMLASPFTVNL